MIKQIVDFSRDEAEGGSATIEVFLLVEDPEKYVESLRALMEDGAIIESADGDAIRAKFKGTTQDKLLTLIDEGWCFDRKEEAAQ